MTKIDSSQNTQELMDVSVIDINTWERAGAPAADKMQSAPIRGAIFVLISCLFRVYMRFYQGRFGWRSSSGCGQNANSSISAIGTVCVKLVNKQKKKYLSWAQ